MKAHIFFITLLYFTASSNGDITTCEQSSQQTHYHLRSDLLCDYYYDVRPKLEHKNATVISMRMIVKSFTYDMYSNLLTVNNWLAMSWSDDHLKWDPANYEHVDLIHLSSDEIWTPDMSIYNKHSHDTVHRIFDNGVDCIVRNTGNVRCVPPNKHEALCTADLRNYPYDIQVCTMRFGSWVHTGEEIDFKLQLNPVTLDSNSNSEWKVLNATAAKRRGKYKGFNSTYPSVSFTFTIQRHTSFHEAVVVVPSLAVIAITLFAFYLEATENERFYLIIANVLLHFLLIQDISWTLPNGGDYAPNILIFTRDSLILCIVEFIVTLILRRMIKSSETIHWASAMIVTLVQSRIGQAILVYDNSAKAAAIARGDEDGANIIETSENASNIDYIKFAKLVDRILCITFIIIYISMFVRFIP